MLPEKKIEDEEEEDLIALNVDSTLLESVQILFKTEPEVEIFYDELLEKIESNKYLKKHPEDREKNNKIFLDQLLKYHTLETINDTIKQVSTKEEKPKNKTTSQEEKEIDIILRRTFNKKGEFRQFMTLLSQCMMQYKKTPIEATAIAMQRLNKTDEEILDITNIIDKVFEI